MSKQQERLDELQAKLAAGMASIKTSDEWKQALRTSAKFHDYSYANAVLIMVQHFHAYEAGLVSEPLPTRVAGYRKWQELGRQVDKGQKSYQILAPVMARFASTTPSDPGSFRKLAFKERPNANETVVTRMVNVRTVSVFDVSQTSGEPLPEFPAPQLLHGAAPAGAWDLLAAQVEDAGYTIRFTDETQLRGANGMVVFDSKEVFVHRDRDAAQQVKTLAHELGHIRLHAPEHFDRDSRPLGSIEMEAESFAFMVCDRLGMDTSDYTFGYVASWSRDVNAMVGASVDGADLSAEEVDAAHLKLVGERVRKAAVPVLDAIESAQSNESGAGAAPTFEQQAQHAVQQADIEAQQQQDVLPPHIALGD